MQSLNFAGTAAVLFLFAAPGYATDLMGLPGTKSLTASVLRADAGASTRWTAFEGSIFSPLQLFSQSTGVRGLRINLAYAKNASMYGFDVGMVNEVEGRTAGFQAAGVANVTTELEGVQIGVLFNDSRGWAKGSQMAVFANVARGLGGMQGGFMFNEVEESIRGLQWTGVVNIARRVEGAQIAGFHNKSEGVVGAQISGLVNQAQGLVGVQIGLLNFNEGGPLPFFPIVNVGW